MPAWHFLSFDSKAAQAEHRGRTALVLNQEGSRFVVAYPTRERASAAALALGQHFDHQDGHRLISLKMPDALSFVCGLGAPKLMFDFVLGAREGYGTDIYALPTMYSHFIGPPPIDCLPMMARLANEHRDPRMFMDLYVVLASLDALYLLRDSSDHAVLVPRNGKSVCPLFTDETAAKAAADQLQADGLLACNIEQVLGFVTQMRASLADAFGGMLVDMHLEPFEIHEELLAKVIEPEVG
ncbi:MAG: hypothetical protein AAGI17_04425 [Planctomycetota bacterium]